MSNIDDILQAIADVTVTVNGEDVRGKCGDDMPNSIHSADLPYRQVMLRDSEEDGVQAISMGSFQARWSITDRMIWKSVAMGGGLDEILPVLHKYAAQYAATMGQHIKIAKSSLIEQMTAELAVWEYPAESDNKWHIVEYELVVSEVF